MLVYKITNTVNGKMYIGQTQHTLKERWRGHIDCMRRHIDRPLYNDMNKYGIDVFKSDVIRYVKDRDEALRYEHYYIAKYNTVNTGYNMGYGGYDNVMDSPVVKDKHDTKMRTAEVRSKISETMKQYRKDNPFTDEHKQKISNAMKGNQNFKGHKLSDSHQQLLRKSHFKGVYCIDTEGNKIAVFDSVIAAARWWYDNGYSDIKNWKNLSNAIKKSNVRDIYIRGLKWIYV